MLQIIQHHQEYPMTRLVLAQGHDEHRRKRSKLTSMAMSTESESSGWPADPCLYARSKSFLRTWSGLINGSCRSCGMVFRCFGSLCRQYFMTLRRSASTRTPFLVGDNGSAGITVPSGCLTGGAMGTAIFGNSIS